VIAHVAALPLEELAPVLGGVGGGLLVARAWITMHLRRPREAGR
jgi:hypothetical protein